MNNPASNTRFSIEYVALLAFLISIGAMGTDLMLPALKLIGVELRVNDPNDVHLIVTTFFLGMALGQIIVGPLSDQFGRKPIILIGYLVFLLGCFLSMFAESWAMMLTGRVIQGFGAAAPRIVTMALIRDEYEGRAMAKILSIVMALFIIVPILAPALGQALIYLASWKATFAALAALAVIVMLWFWLRQPETLAVSARRTMSLSNMWGGLLEVIRTRIALGYTIAMGLMYGMFVGYLGSAQQIFQETFNAGDLFVVYFALASLSIGAASLLNATLVMRLGMRKLTWYALVCLTALSMGFCLVLFIYAGIPPLPLFLFWQLSAFFCVGVIFANMNSIALEPLGHIAGLASAFIGSLATFMSLPLAWLIGQHFDGTVFPLVAGFAILALSSCVVVVWTEKAEKIL